MEAVTAIAIGPDESALSRLWQRACTPACRGKRVILLLVAVIAMSLGDLDMTLLYLRQTGMIEENPLARAVMMMGSPLLLAAWKLLSLALCVFLLYRFRHHRTAELGAWVCFLTLAWLCLRWVSYTEEIPQITRYLASGEVADDHRWVTMTGETP